MWLARNFPGLNLGIDDVEAMTPEQTNTLRKAGAKIIEREEKMRFEHTRLIAMSNGMKLR